VDSEEGTLEEEFTIGTYHLPFTALHSSLFTVRCSLFTIHCPVDGCDDLVGGDGENASRLAKDSAFVTGTRLTIEGIKNDLVWSVGPRAPVVAV